MITISVNNDVNEKTWAMLTIIRVIYNSIDNNNKNDNHN